MVTIALNKHPRDTMESVEKHNQEWCDSHVGHLGLLSLVHSPGTLALHPE